MSNLARQLIERGDSIRCETAAEFEAVIAALAGCALHVRIEHDDACTPSVCMCSPHYVIERLSVDTYTAGRDAQRRWLRESTS